MKTGTITILTATAAFGLMLVTAEPAKAHDSVLDVAFHLGPAYVRYRDGYHRVYRVGRDWRRYGHRHPRTYPRSYAAHDLWHRCYDGRWYRYHDRKHWRRHDERWRGHKHWRRHDKRGRGHKHGQRGKRRHRDD